MTSEEINKRLFDNFYNPSFENKLNKFKINLIRQNAKKRFVSLGVPKEKDEYWKFAKPNNFISPKEKIDKKNILRRNNSLNIDTDFSFHFVDGSFKKNKSKINESSKIIFNTLEDEFVSSDDWIKTFYSHCEEIAQFPIKRPLAALNSSLANYGYVIRIPENENTTILINYDSKRENSDILFHSLIEVKANSKLTIIENGDLASRSNSVLEINIDDGGELNHVRIQGNDRNVTSLSHIFSLMGEKSIFNTSTVNLGAAFSRNEYFTKISGEKSKLSISGASIGVTENSTQDDTIFISHDEKECESRQIFKKVLTNNSTGVFQGKILVKDRAQKTDGYQISKGLLLDENSKFLAKPELEIYADDVICSHGSTCGNVDEETLFYLTSRGISKYKATEMIVLAFLDEALTEIENPKILAEIRNLIEKNLELKLDEK